MSEKQSIGSRLLSVLWGALKQIPWKPILKNMYFEVIKPELAAIAAESETKVDDLAFTALDFAAVAFLGKPDELAAQKEALVAAVVPAPAPEPLSA